MNTKSRSPGPAAYFLPTNVGYEKHDLRKRRLPQYSFGSRFPLGSKFVSPGPGAYDTSKITRHGLNGAPKYTMGPKTRFIGGGPVSPGPASNDYHLKPIFKGTNAPAYSLRSRHYVTEKVASPAPNNYSIKMDFLKQRAPGYSMARILPKRDNKFSPGPAAYGPPNSNAYRRQSPSYSIGGRNFAKTPGPNGVGAARYNLQTYLPGRTQFKYSFGIKHSEYAPPMIVACDNVF